MISKQQRFWELFLFGTELKIDFDTYPTSIFRFRGEDFLWEYDSKNGNLYLSYEKIWSVLKKEYHMEYNEIKSFIKDQAEKHFNCKGVTPAGLTYTYWTEIEKHFKK